MSIEVMKQALEALDVANSCVDGYYIPKGKTHLPEVEKAITSLRQAIAAEQTQEQMFDLMTFGMSLSKDGKRIDPREVYGIKGESDV